MLLHTAYVECSVCVYRIVTRRERERERERATEGSVVLAGVSKDGSSSSTAGTADRQ